MKNHPWPPPPLLADSGIIAPQDLVNQPFASVNLDDPTQQRLFATLTKARDNATESHKVTQSKYQNNQLVLRGLLQDINAGLLVD
ncbi:MAG: hypothetical protein H7839_08750 [Magnetococcus sp. YQC-5]